jgi:hypothetical protein
VSGNSGPLWPAAPRHASVSCAVPRLDTSLDPSLDCAPGTVDGALGPV